MTSNRSRAPVILLVLAGIGAAKAAAWFHFRRQQPDTDARTRDRLAPKGGRA